MRVSRYLGRSKMPEKHLTSYMNAPLSNVAFELEKSPTLGSIETEAVKRRFSVATHEFNQQTKVHLVITRYVQLIYSESASKFEKKITHLTFT